LKAFDGDGVGIDGPVVVVVAVV